MDDFWAYTQELEKEYHACRKKVMERYTLSAMEVDVILFLANNPQYDTAADIVRMQKRQKSHVSLAVRGLMKKGYISGKPDAEDRKKIRLNVTEQAETIVCFGREQQKIFVNAIFEGFTVQEKEMYFSFCRRIQENARIRQAERGRHNNGK